MKIEIITLFPQSFFGPFNESIIKRAREKQIVDIRAVDLRDYTDDLRKTVDDRPFGGGPGMVMKPDPIYKAIEDLKKENSIVIMTSPAGRRFTQSLACEFSNIQHMIILCGHYEGIDARVKPLIDCEVSIGDYILTNGNLAAMVMVDAIVRLLPGALGCAESAIEESFSDGLLEYPQYTRPQEFRGMKVPDILLTGNHEAIAKWRHQESVKYTQEHRPDLIDQKTQSKI